jgi:ethanolamine utilization cobalamin adenosyltransferase
VQETFGLDKQPQLEPSHGRLAARINYLRARIREGEILAVKVYGRSIGKRMDIIKTMNRFSSALWWLFCHACSRNAGKLH